MSKYKIQLDLPGAWDKEESTYIECDGTEVCHIECHLSDDKAQKDLAIVELYAGKMPADTTAEDEAFANYVETVGFDENDPEDMDPIIKWPFMGKSAFGFEALCEDESPMRLMCLEIKKDYLCIMNICADSDERLTEVIQLVEKHLRCKTTEQ